MRPSARCTSRRRTATASARTSWPATLPPPSTDAWTVWHATWLAGSREFDLKEEFHMFVRSLFGLCVTGLLAGCSTVDGGHMGLMFKPFGGGLQHDKLSSGT